jgi:hypothetical protein
MKKNMKKREIVRKKERNRRDERNGSKKIKRVYEK